MFIRLPSALALAVVASFAVACVASDPTEGPTEGTPTESASQPPATPPKSDGIESHPYAAPLEATCEETTQTLCARACRCTSAGEAECTFDWGHVLSETIASSDECVVKKTTTLCSGAKKIDHLACARALRQASCVPTERGVALAAPRECDTLLE